MPEQQAEQIRERDFMYEVIHFFTDLQDFEHPYNVGDKFPRDGMQVSNERLNELSGKNNRQKKPLIKKISEPEFEEREEKYNEENPKYTKTDINKMSTSQLQSLAAESGIEDAGQKNGGELKKLLIEKFSL